MNADMAAVSIARTVPAGIRRRLACLPALILLSCLGAIGQVQAQSCAIGETPAAFGFTGGEQTTTVPAGVTSVTVYLSGAQGGAGRSGAGTIGGSPNSPGGTGGLGGRVRGTLAVTPGSLLSIWVGGQASQAVNPGGIGQGVDGIGGGATDLRVGGNAIGNRVGIAGGGGGGGNAGWSTTNVIAGGNGGVGGGGVGAVGATVPGGPGPFGGGGGAVGTGGAGGAGCGGFPATAGNAANGDGGDSFNFSGSFTGAGFGGGGGGGATVGAGGGGAGVGTTACQQNWNGGGGGGAGGSSGATGLTAVTINNGVQAGNGAALICFAASQFSVGGTATGHNGPVTLQLAATNPVSSQQVVVAQAATTFVFPTLLPQGANWNVSVLSAPAGQLCSVTPASGAAIAANVTNVALTCTTVAVTVNPATLPNGAFNTAYSQTLSATSANGGIAPYTFSVTAGALPAGLTLSSAGVLSGTPTAAGSFNFTVQATSTNGFSGTRAYTVAIAQNAQAITAFTANPAAPVFTSGGTFTVSATGGASGNPVVFASTTPAVCTVAGATVTMVSAGNCGLTANQAGNANFSAAPQVALNVVIGQATQAITAFVANPAAPVYAPSGTFNISATGGFSGNPVVFASTTPAICTVAGGTVTMVSAGNCALTANQAGNASYSAAPQVALNVAIGLAAQAITNFTANPAAPVYSPNGTFALSATGGASTSPVVFASTTPAVCTVSGSTATMLTAGNCALTANQAGDANYSPAAQVALNVTIGLASQAITNFTANPAAPVYAPNGTFTLSATGGASTSPVVFASTTPAVCTVSGNTVTMVTAGSCSLTANQAGDASYSPAPQATLVVSIGLATPTLSWIPNQVKIFGEPAFDLPNPTSNSTGAITFSSSNPAVATVSGRTVTIVGDGVTTLVATQAAAGSYAQATISATLTVDDRPDPTRDPSVVDSLQAQVDASVRFASAQQTNIRDRLRQQRHAGAQSSSNGLSLNLTNGSGGALSLSAGQMAPGGKLSLPEGLGLWTAGTITAGERDARSGLSDGFDFRSDGITVGADWRIDDRFLFGVAGGFGWSNTDFDDPRSALDGEQHSVSVYGLWRQGEHFFVDGVLGWGRLDFDIRRWSSTAGAAALATRDGDQAFGSLTVGYEHRTDGMSLTGYGRVDASRTRLDAYRETGLGIFDLAYGDQTVENNSFAVGLEGNYLFQGRNSFFRPYWMIEYRDAFENQGDVALNYVVSPRSTDYALGLRSYGDNALTYGGGLDIDIASSWRLSVLFRREHASGTDASTIGLLLSFSPGARNGVANTDSGNAASMSATAGSMDTLSKSATTGH
ncbi:MAG: autotransporter domain-containing protein [Pseudomonadota bacterium]